MSVEKEKDWMENNREKRKEKNADREEKQNEVQKIGNRVKQRNWCGVGKELGREDQEKRQ